MKILLIQAASTRRTYDASGGATDAQVVPGGRLATRLAEEAYRRNRELLPLFGAAAEESLAVAIRKGLIRPEDLYPENTQTATLTSQKSGNHVQALRTTAKPAYAYLHFVDIGVERDACDGFLSVLGTVGRILFSYARTYFVDGYDFTTLGPEAPADAAVVRALPFCSWTVGQ